jgi:hypothetical protein
MKLGNGNVSCLEISLCRKLKLLLLVCEMGQQKGVFLIPSQDWLSENSPNNKSIHQDNHDFLSFIKLPKLKNVVVC